MPRPIHNDFFYAIALILSISLVLLAGFLFGCSDFTWALISAVICTELDITQQNDAITRLFDEVDVGIGGKTAALVGSLLRTLGEKSQVLCITHQPQTAAQGHQHLYVEKNTGQFQVRHLDHEAKIREVARMLGGLEITAHTLAHAKELMYDPS